MPAGGFTVTVEVDRAVSRVFGYLADPANRPAWQASLRRIDPVTTGPPGVGTRWYDVTWPGPRPLMEITDWQPDRRWAETGRWHGLEVALALEFTALGPERTRVRASTATHAPGWRRPLGLVLDLLGPLGARDDLRRAGRLC